VKAWTSILVAGAVLAFAAPAGFAAGHASSGGNGSARSAHTGTHGATNHIKRLKVTGVISGNGVYGPYGYVPASELPNLEKAFRKAAH
jgi:hypothetical protein